MGVALLHVLAADTMTCSRCSKLLTPETYPGVVRWPGGVGAVIVDLPPVYDNGEVADTYYNGDPPEGAVNCGG